MSWDSTWRDLSVHGCQHSDRRPTGNNKDVIGFMVVDTIHTILVHAYSPFSVPGPGLRKSYYYARVDDRAALHKPPGEPSPEQKTALQLLLLLSLNFFSDLTRLVIITIPFLSLSLLPLLTYLPRLFTCSPILSRSSHPRPNSRHHKQIPHIQT